MASYGSCDANYTISQIGQVHKLWILGNRESGIGNGESGIGNRESGTSDQGIAMHGIFGHC
ncbi:hypothetical protein BJP34_11165 [Moorena producens PAL-8-15-08-1]|uniref:Uncharacterized protein n=1 Tax=Moorena producens PAL-8-15-08-1 TaxID=1458985 RepID=A0A1D8TQK6_9CYAN|nr:hypothetical protein BJP34_11165 [Moorena producens PAL-8-15-08-1]